jgi:hypothetical protein
MPSGIWGIIDREFLAKKQFLQVSNCFHIPIEVRLGIFPHEVIDGKSI